MINWEEYETEQREEADKCEGYRHASLAYEGGNCANRGRPRLARRKNGLLICDKCGWNQIAGEYDWHAVDHL